MNQPADPIQRWNVLDLAAKIGGLSIHPSNLDLWPRLRAAATIVQRLNPRDVAKPLIDREALQTWLEGQEVSELTNPFVDDAFPDFLTESFAFFDGPYTLLTGGLDDGTYTLRYLCEAVFNRVAPLGDSCTSRVFRATMCALAISDAISKRAGYTRLLLPTANEDRSIVIPDDNELSCLAACVTFTAADLRELLGDAFEALPLFSARFEEVISHSIPTMDGISYSPPLLQHDDHFVVVDPLSLVSNLNAQIVKIVENEGEVEQLKLALLMYVMRNVVRSLGVIGARAVGLSLPDPPADGNIKEQFFSIDTDKLLHCIVIVDDLQGFGSGIPVWDTEQVTEIARRRIVRVDELMAESNPLPVSILHLVLFQDAGRHFIATPIDSRQPPQSVALTLTPRGLEIIAMLDGGNQLLLWQFAQALERLHATANTIVSDPLDLYALYRAKDSSFYLNDNPLPNVLHLQTGIGTDFRREALLQMDCHVVQSYDEQQMEEVFRITKGTPIFAILPQPGSPQNDIAQFVEGFPIGIWVVALEAHASGDAELVCKELVNMVTYWLWQFTDIVSDLLTPLASVADAPLVIEIEPEPGISWTSSDESTAEPVCAAEIITHRRIAFRVGAGMAKAFGVADNSGERYAMSTLLRAVVELNSRASSQDHALQNADAFLQAFDKRAPLGRKKKILAYSSGTNPRLDPRDLPRSRNVQASEEHRILDDIGDYVTNTLRVPNGVVQPADQGKLLNSIVSHLYERLKSSVAALSPNGLLETLVRHNERHIYEDAFVKLTTPTRIECYSTLPEMVDTFRKEYAERSKSYVASRILIEFVVAQPPSGHRPLSLGAYDELLALISELMSKAMLSDILQYKLADRVIEVLGSGRLAFDEGAYEAAQSTFTSEFSHTLVSDTVDHFRSHWQNRTDSTRAAPDRTDVDNATTVEFGISFTELVEFLSEVFGLNLDGESPSVQVLPKATFIETLSSKLQWNRDKVERAFQFFAATKRDDYLRPPPPYKQQDVYPWRHNRGLSYFRKPLLVRHNQQSDDVIFGRRHITVALRYLYHLCLSGRLKATTLEMSKVISAIHTAQGEEFNQEVARLYSQIPGVIVKQQVKKIGSTRIQRENGEDLGDIDVFVVDPAARCIRAVETKDLAAALTPFDVESEIKDLFGEHGKLKIHLERVEWLRQHLSEVLAWLGINEPAGNWTVLPEVVFDRPLMSPYLLGSGMTVTSLHRLKASLGLQ